MIPIEEDLLGHYDPPSDYFQTVLPDYGSAFVYDAVMAIGLGACIASDNQGRNGDTSNLSGPDHHRGLRKANFTGASGRVEFAQENVGQGDGVRTFATGMYAAFNMYPPDGLNSASLKSLYHNEFNYTIA